jgi:hypothetical protein
MHHTHIVSSQLCPTHTRFLIMHTYMHTRKHRRTHANNIKHSWRFFHDALTYAQRHRHVCMACISIHMYLFPEVSFTVSVHKQSHTHKHACMTFKSTQRLYSLSTMVTTHTYSQTCKHAYMTSKVIHILPFCKHTFHNTHTYTLTSMHARVQDHTIVHASTQNSLAPKRVSFPGVQVYTAMIVTYGQVHIWLFVIIYVCMFVFISCIFLHEHYVF